MPSPLAIYVHIPFCPTKCGYCDFNSYAMSGDIMGRTTDAIIREIKSSPQKGRPAKTIFFGGGTPTYIPVEQLLSILEAVVDTHPPDGEIEITSEANPGTVDASRFAAMREGGFNRISLGAQSFSPTDLLALGRIHQADHIAKAVEAARLAGFVNLNLDLMFALPGQSFRAWENNIERVLSLRPEHLSLYCLTIEPSTAFYKKNLKGQLDLPDDECQVQMYDIALQLSAQAGYEQYEISNFAKVGRECRHNLCYWRGEEYAGYGPGAVGAVSVDGQRIRYTNLKHPERYCAAVEADEKLAFEEEVLTDEILRMESIMLGIRLNEGMDASCVDPKDVNQLVNRGWLEPNETRLRLTKNGRHFCSEVALQLI